jgi:DNA primase
MIDPDSVEQVRQAADLVELLRGRVELVRRGPRFWARCPFHDEHSPSFTIMPDHRNYYCFGCGVKGDAITWMREREGAGSFAEAIEALADRFNIELKYQETSPQQEAERAAAARRLQLLDRAGAFYAAYLWKADEAEPARRYLTERGFDEELLRRFRVGYAPGAGNVLAGRAAKQGFTRQELVDAGLSRRDGGDFFASRIMFPICDARGRIQGFGGRTLDPNERAKYVNSSEGPAFRKRRLLFNLDQARAPASRVGWVAVAEGYTDVLGMAKAGIDNAVACMGTSLTNEQLRLLARTADEVRLCFDGDQAGQDAAWRSVEAAAGVTVRLSAVPFPGGSDPGGLAGSDDGLVTLREAIEHPEPMMAYLIKARTARTGRSVAERAGALEDITALLRRFPESIEKDDAVSLAASRLELSPIREEDLRVAVRVTPAPGFQPARRSPPAALGPNEGRERRWLALALALPELAPTYVADLTAEAFDEPLNRRAFGLIAAGTAAAAWPEELSALALDLQAAVLDGVPAEAALREATYRLQERLLERRGQAARDAGEVETFLKIQDLLQRLRQAIRVSE